MSVSPPGPLGGWIERLARGDRRRDAVVVLILFVAATVLFFDVLFLGRNIVARDLQTYFYPLKMTVRETILAGGLSWNRWWGGGQPLAANPVHELFYPPQWLILLPDFDLGYRLHLLFHVYAALAGMFLFLRRLGARHLPAAAGALAWGLGPPFLSLLSLPPILFAFAWVPWIGLFADRLVQRFSPRDFVAASAFLVLQLLIGEPASILQTWMLLGAFVVWRCAALRKTGASRAMARAVMLCAALAVASALVAAIQILPALDLGADSRGARAFTQTHASKWSTPPVRFAEILFAPAIGNLEERDALFWGGRLYERAGSPLVTSIYLGILPGAFALAGLIAWRRGAGLVLAVTIVSALLSTGRHAFVFRVLYDAGIYRLIRYPEKWILGGLFTLIVFGALMFDRALRGDRLVLLTASAVSLAIGAGAGSLALAARTGWFASMFSSFFRLPPSVLSQLMLETFAAESVRRAMIATALGLLLFLKGRPGVSRLVLPALLILAAGDVLTIVTRLDYRVPPGFFTSAPGATAELPPHARIVPSDGATGPGSSEMPIEGEPDEWIIRNGLFWRTPQTWGYSTVLERDYDATMLSHSVDSFYLMEQLRWWKREEARDAVARMSNASAIVETAGWEPDRVLTTDYRQLRLSRFRRVIPPGPYYFADRLLPALPVQDLARALAERPVAGAIAFVPFRPFAPAGGTILSVEESPSAATLRVRTSGRAVLVTATTDHKYWSAAIDGRPVSIRRANVSYQAVVVPPGEHTIDFRYRNPLLAIGAFVSFVSAAALLIWAIGSPPGARALKGGL